MALSAADAAVALRAAREAKGHTFVAVAMVCDVDPAEIEAWETVRPWDSASHASTLAGLYDLDASFFSSLTAEAPTDEGNAIDSRPQGPTTRRRSTSSTGPARLPAPKKKASTRTSDRGAGGTKRSAPARRPRAPGIGNDARRRSPAAPERAPAVIRLAVDVALLDAGSLAMASRLAGIPTGEASPTDARHAELIAAVAMALSEFGSQTRGALGVLERLEEADALAIGLAVGRSDPGTVAEIGRLLAQAEVPVASDVEPGLAVATALAGLNAESRGGLSRVARLVCPALGGGDTSSATGSPIGRTS